MKEDSVQRNVPHTARKDSLNKEVIVQPEPCAKEDVDHGHRASVVNTPHAEAGKSTTTIPKCFPLQLNNR
jgi:hypothetical protein